MVISTRPAELDSIQAWREMYRLEMNCQIIHDSIHSRAGWTQEYSFHLDGIQVGYGSVAVAGPWTAKPTVYEFYVVPQHRVRLFELFLALLNASGAVKIEIQSNDRLASAMLHTFARDVSSESILFEDKLTTAHAPPGVNFREATLLEMPDVPRDQLRWHGVVESEGSVVATGGVLFHYNRPYGDIYMEVAKSFRGRGFGTFLVQELKRVCFEGGHVPGARCNPGNVGSRKTLQKAGFVPCGHILTGSVWVTP
jgi:RimJ/RimL family protein N-acetyltransferase